MIAKPLRDHIILRTRKHLLTRGSSYSLIWDRLDGRCKDIFIRYCNCGLMDLAHF